MSYWMSWGRMSGSVRLQAGCWEVSFLAVKTFARYKQAGGGRKRMLADFLIGAHTAVAGFGLITRDQGIGKHFKIGILNPGAGDTP